MKTFIDKIIDKYCGYINRTTFAESHKQWLQAKGDQILRYEYPLGKDSIVFDVGGFKGEWTDEIFRRYQPNVHVFEPFKKYFIILNDKFKDNNKIHIHAVGLSNRKLSAKMSFLGDGTTVYKAGDHVAVAKFIDVTQFILDNKIKRINLMKINIEGGEYDLLERLVETDLVKMVDDIQVQFHNFVPDAKNRMERIQAGLAKTHVATYHFPFVWENWRIKKSGK